MTAIDVVNVFTLDGSGGNPCPIVLQASRLAPEEMKEIARHHGHESGFVLPPRTGDSDFHFRFWVPNHEMEMCGHATIGALWLLASEGRLPGEVLRFATLSGPLTGLAGRQSNCLPALEITRPVGKVTPLSAEQEADVLRVLKLERGDLLDL